MAPSVKPSYTTNTLKRWSCKSKELPPVADIKAIHVYDFDNTLFSSPLPNPQIWITPTIGQLSQAYDMFAEGGWWHNPSVLEATGEGVEKEEPRGWAGYWNESVLELLKLSMLQKDVLTVLLTGRAETKFADLINRILNSRELDCDLVVLKPDVSPLGQSFNSTMDFKQAFLRDLVFTYKTADEIRVYEDRPGHVKGFREYFERLNKSLLSHRIDEPAPPRKTFTAEVVAVCELRATLDPEVEVETVQRMVNAHNQAVANGAINTKRTRSKLLTIRENFVYCGYLISPKDSARLISLTNCPPNLIDNGEIRFLASSILISPHRADPSLLAKVGGKGHKVTWQVTGLAILENRIWAARVAPLLDTDEVHTPDTTPLVVLALRKGTRPIDANRIQHWNPVQPEKGLIFETVVGDKVTLKLEEGDVNGGYGYGRGKAGYGAKNGRLEHGLKRKFQNGDDDELRNKENRQQGGRKGEGYANGDRDDGTWVPKGGAPTQNNNNGGGAGDRHGQARFFHQGKQQNNEGRNFSSGHRGGRGGGGKRNEQHSGENAGRGARGNDRGRGGGGGRGRGGNRAPPGYKSLDDYGPGGFDGPGDTKGAGGGGEMVMNY